MLLIQNLGLHFAGSYLFSEVSFRINPKDRIGLAGKNGAGKSTLLKILSGEKQGTEGEVIKEGSDIRIGFLKQDLEFTKGRTVWDETKQAFTELVDLEKKIDYINQQLVERTDYETESYHKLIDDLTDFTERFGMLGGYQLEADMEQVLMGLGFKKDDFERLTDVFSGGWRMRIELAKLLLQQNDVLLLDEPTNHLDIESIIWLEQFLQSYNGAVVLVSHDIQFLSTVTNRTIEISNKTIQDYKANYQKFLILREERISKLQQAQKNQEQHIKQTEMLIDKFRAKASKATMAQSLMKKLDKIERIEVENEDVTNFRVKFEPSIQPGKVIFEANKVGKSFGDKTVFSDADFFIERGEKIAFLGQNGQGKTTLAKIMAKVMDCEGDLKQGHNVQIGYFAQNQEEVLTGTKTVLQEAEDAANEQTRPRVRELLGAFLFRGEEVEKRVKVLSGGERNRLALCKLLLQPFNVLIMDEPTNHLDIHSKEIIKTALRNFDGTLIIVSHDRDFLDGLADKIFEFRNGKVKEFLGDVNEYLAYRKKENMREVDMEKAVKNQETRVEKQERKNAEDLNQKANSSNSNKNIQNKISKLENEIAELEKQLSAIENQFSKENPSAEKMKTYEEMKLKLKNRMEEWEENLLLIE